MAKNESTKGQGAKDGEVKKRATSRTSSAGTGGAGGTTAETGAGSPAKRTAAKKTATAKKAAAKTAGAGTAPESSTGKGAAATTRRVAAKSPRKTTAAGGGMRDDLRAFARAHPGGWGHDQWLTLVEELRGKGYDVSDTDAVGMQLERERLAVALESEGVKGKAADALVGRFETVWSLRQASVDDIASVKGVTRAQAERVKERLE